MSNHLTNNEAAEPATGAKRRRKVWLASGVAGLTGVVSLAGVGVATGAGAAGVDGLRWATAQVSQDGDKGGDRHDENRDWRGKGDDKDRRDDKDRKDDKVKEVPCDTDKLIQAIVFANQNHGATLELAKDCTYNLTRYDEFGNGLPVITERVTLKGDKTKIVRDATAEYFRILNVGPGGHLTVKGLTIKGGQTLNFLTAPEPAAVWSAYSTSVEAQAAATKAGKAVAMTPRTTLQAAPKATPKGGVSTLVEEPEFNDGAGILVQPGGSADIEHSEVLQNQSGGNGGGVANFGTTSIRQSTIAENTAFFFGGGVFNAGVLRVYDSKVTNNEAGIGGAGISNGAAEIFTDDVDGGTVWVEKSEISRNKTIGFGGGILDIEGNTTVKQSKISDNTALVAGGGIATAESSLNLYDVKVEKNSTIGVGGGLAIAFGSRATIENTSIKDNVAAFFGGGLFNEGSITVLRKSEVVGNRAVGPIGIGGGIFNVGGEVRLDKTKVAHNFSTLPPGGIFTNNSGVIIDDKSAVTANRPTNCLGLGATPPNCFG
ncbi:right-handed parallel beta-helix repeat-containing protein [Micromonospora sp. 15K316]|uniref:right-handed parallel beta-helix repeat-containing protein n=1 Tax=Micromonospora sp. 15K316 TaxID=2530376 RepID=UPI0010528072|nr:right-handed parallel beta-helix repeat-containing protein [Micromonospora sp. 15K316]TDC30933.1 right-handed parallel beta-helix repeat-containing protein [Micromonospora sp. 15K316]